MIDITWQPAYTIKAYPELRGLFGRGENHLLAYLHNWVAQLTKKGKAQDPEWVFLTQQQIADAIDYSVSSVKRFIQQINDKVQDAIQVRSRPVYLTKFFSYTVYEYRVDWSKVLSFLAAQSDGLDSAENARMAQSSHLHFERGVAQAELGVAQNELTYKNPFKDPINNKKPSPTPPKESEQRESELEMKIGIERQIPDPWTSYPGLIQPLEQIQDISEGRSSAAAEKMSSLTPQQAASMGLVRSNAADGSQTWVESPAGRIRGQSTWIQQGVALGFWENKDLAIEFQGQVAQYARNQAWCKSPLDYTNSVIKGLLAGDNPKADRYWEAWRNGHPVGWENLFDWEVQPGVFNPAFVNWVETSLFDSSKSMAANAAAAAKELKFNVRELWARFQRMVAREVENAQAHHDRGQTYLPPGALLPRNDQPTEEQTYQGLNRLMQAAALVRPESWPQIAQSEVAEAAAPVLMSAEEFAAAQPDKADILARMQSIGSVGGRSTFDKYADEPAPLPEPPAPEINTEAPLHSPSEELASEEPVAAQAPPPRPLTIELLPEVIAKRKQLEMQWRRKKPPYDLAKMAKYLVWAHKGDEAMQSEAIEWLEVNDTLGG